MTGFSAFDTPLGPCGIAWRGASVIGCALPAEDRDTLLRHLGRRHPDGAESEPPEPVQLTIGLIIRLFNGDAVDFSPVRLALDEAAPFERQVYAAASAIPHGQTRTYGELARAIGSPGAARAVGRALGRNPIPIIIPCHRIVAADGRSGGFSAPGGISTKIRLLQIERARRGSEPGLFDDLRWAAAPART